MTGIIGIASPDKRTLTGKIKSYKNVINRLTTYKIVTITEYVVIIAN